LLLRNGMALSNAERQRRWRRRRDDLVRTNPAVIEADLLADVRRCERGELSARARAALADQLMVAAFAPWRWGHAFSRVAAKVRGESSSPLRYGGRVLRASSL